MNKLLFWTFFILVYLPIQAKAQKPPITNVRAVKVISGQDVDTLYCGEEYLVKWDIIPPSSSREPDKFDIWIYNEEACNVVQLILEENYFNYGSHTTGKYSVQITIPSSIYSNNKRAAFGVVYSDGGETKKSKKYYVMPKISFLSPMGNKYCIFNNSLTLEWKSFGPFTDDADIMFVNTATKWDTLIAKNYPDPDSIGRFIITDWRWLRNIPSTGIFTVKKRLAVCDNESFESESGICTFFKQLQINPVNTNLMWRQNQPYELTLTAKEGIPRYRWNISGISYEDFNDLGLDTTTISNTTSFRITANPKANDEDFHQYSLTVTANSKAPNDSDLKLFQIAVLKELEIMPGALKDFIQNVPYSETMHASYSDTVNLIWRGENLPEYFALDPIHGTLFNSDGRINETTILPDIFQDINITVRDRRDDTIDSKFTDLRRFKKLIFTAPVPPDTGYINCRYDGVLSASSHNINSHWSIADSGNLTNQNLRLYPNTGAFSFTPNTAEEKWFIASITDESSQIVSARVSVIIMPAIIVDRLQIIAPDTLKYFIQNKSYFETLMSNFSSTVDSVNLRWSCTPMLPFFTFDSLKGTLSNESGQVDNAVALPDSVEITFVVRNNLNGDTDSTAKSFYMWNELTFPPRQLPHARVQCPYQFQLQSPSSNTDVRWELLGTNGNNHISEFRLEPNGELSFRPLQAAVDLIQIYARVHDESGQSITDTFFVDILDKFQINTTCTIFYNAAALNEYQLCANGETNIAWNLDSCTVGGVNLGPSGLLTIDPHKILSDSTYQIVISAIENSRYSDSRRFTIFPHNSLKIYPDEAGYIKYGRGFEKSYYVADKYNVEKPENVTWSYESDYTFLDFDTTGNELEVSISWDSTVIDCSFELSATINGLNTPAAISKSVDPLLINRIEILSPPNDTLKASLGKEYSLLWKKYAKGDSCEIFLKLSGLDSVLLKTIKPQTGITTTILPALGPTGKHWLKIWQVNEKEIGDSIPINISPTDTTIIYPTIEANKYLLFTSPLRLSDVSVTANLFPIFASKYNKEKWRLLSVSGSDYYDYSTYDASAFELLPGRSYLLITSEKKDNLQMEGRLVGDTSYSVPLRSGWNFVANPYFFDLDTSGISFNYAGFDTSTDEHYYFYNAQSESGWVSNRTAILSGQKGYAIKVNIVGEGGTKGEIVFKPDWKRVYQDWGKAVSPNERVQGKSRAGMALEKSKWYIKITGENEKAYDTENYVGIVSDTSATRAFNYSDEPPPLGEFLRIRLDYNPTNILHDSWIWDLHFSTSVSSSSTIHFSNVQSISSEYEVGLLDESSLKRIDLRENTFTSINKKQGTFKLLVSKNVEDLLKAANPTYFTLSPAYPNPFNSMTTVEYAVPVPSAIKISVFDINGRFVANLLDTKQEPGFYKLTWDGNDKNKRQVATGVYFIKMTSPKSTAVSKVALIK